MPASQIKIFKVPITPEIDLDEKSIEVINIFLKEENIIYLNHSSSVLFESKKDTTPTRVFNHNRYLVISIVYKDLKVSNVNVSKLSGKMKEKAIQTLGNDEASIQKPDFKTEIDKIP